MLKVLLLDELQQSRAELAMGLMQAGYVVAVAADVSAAHQKLLQMEFDWLLCRRAHQDHLVDGFLDGIREQSVHADVLKLLLLSDLPVERPLHEWPLAEVRTGQILDDADAIINLMTKKPKANHLVPVKLPAPTYAGPLMIGSCETIKQVSRRLKRVAHTDSTVLITGESGTGKELAAQSIHMESPRANKPLVPINCGAIPDELLESELFGHTRGAFTGANASRKGRVALAQGGTLFLDEVGEMPMNLQVKLLRVLQEQEYTPVGSDKALKADVRVIAATNQNLEALISQKLFREDLYYRLNVIPITLPPLRERQDDIPELISYFLTLFNEQFQTEIHPPTQRALDAMLKYPWPGNIRELRNIVERMVILNDSSVLQLSDLPEKIQAYAEAEVETPANTDAGGVVLPENGLHFYEAVEEFERALILQALDRTDWNKKKAADLLKMNRTTLVEKIKKRDISKT